ncbi:MAG: MATE family efflux transporter [Clostridia bacterium]|nr:MATE family efflux transporter [Clostridia bacterium]
MNKSPRSSLALEMLRFSLPLMMSGVLQQLYSWADAFIIGHAEGEMQLAAVGATTSLSSFLSNTILGLTLGLSIMAAQHVGAGRRERIRAILSSFLPVLAAGYALVTMGAFFFLEPVLALMDTPPEIFADALSYLRIILLGVPFLVCYNLYAALLRALGNTKAAFYAVLLSSCVNVVLDILLVAVLPFGVAGAAAATVLSQIGMTIFIVLYAAKKEPALLRPAGVGLPLRGVLFEGMRFAAPPALKNSVTSFGHLALQSFMNSFGSTTVLAVTTAYRVDCITLLPIINLGAAISIIAAQASGAKDGRRIRACLKTGLNLMLVISVLLAAAMFAFGALFVGFFGVTGDALRQGRVFFQDLSIFYPVFGLSIVLQSVLEGVGDISFCSMMGVASLALRIALSYALRPVFAERTIAIAEGIVWVVTLAVFSFRMALRKTNFFCKEGPVDVDKENASR